MTTGLQSIPVRLGVLYKIIGFLVEEAATSIKFCCPIQK